MAVAESRASSSPEASGRSVERLGFHDLLSSEDIALMRAVANETLQKREAALADHSDRRRALRENFDRVVHDWVALATAELTDADLAARVITAADTQRGKFRRNRLTSRAVAKEFELADVLTELCAVLAITVLLDVWLPVHRDQLMQAALPHFDSPEVVQAWREHGSAKPPSHAEAVVLLDTGLSELEEHFSAVTSKTNTRLPARLVAGLTSPSPVRALRGWLVDELGRHAFPNGLRERASRHALTLGEHLLMARLHHRDVQRVVQAVAGACPNDDDHDLRQAWRKVESQLSPASAARMSMGGHMGVWDRLLAAAMLAARSCRARAQPVHWPKVLKSEVFPGHVGETLLILAPIGGPDLPWWDEPFIPAGWHVAHRLLKDVPKWAREERQVEVDLVVEDTIRRLAKTLRRLEREDSPFIFEGPTRTNKFVSTAADHAIDSRQFGGGHGPAPDQVVTMGPTDLAEALSTMPAQSMKPLNLFSLLAELHLELEELISLVAPARVPVAAQDLRLWLEWLARREALGVRPEHQVDPLTSATDRRALSESPDSLFLNSFLDFTATSVWAVNHPGAGIGERKHAAREADKVLKQVIAALTADNGEWS